MEKHHIRKALIEFLWERKFESNSMNEKVNNSIQIENMLSNYIDETITCDDRDPTWINKNIKQLILEKSQAYNKSFLKSNTFLQFLNLFHFL